MICHDDGSVTLTADEAQGIFMVAQRGDSLGGMIAATVQLGHESPASTVEYAHAEEWTAAAFVRDFTAWTAGRCHLAPGCEERLREWGAVEAKNRLDGIFSLDDLLAPERAS